MVEAIVGVALRAILASVLLGGLLAGLVLLATRTLALTAATRHALWTTALIATAIMPLAGVVVSLSRTSALPAEPAIVSNTVTVPVEHAKRSTNTTHGDGASAAASRPATVSVASSDRGPHATRGGRAAWGGAPFNLAPLNFKPFDMAFARWTPRVSRALALGVAGIWLAGALIGLIGLAGSIVRVRGLKRRSSPLDGSLADELAWLTEVDAGREIYLRLSFETETPVAIGFRRPVILIPTELATADGLAAIEQLVLHEHAHLRRYDDWTNLVQRTIERVFWFNPIVWLVGRKIALEREIASDDAVVDKTGEPHAYATSLWKLAREMRMPEHAVVAPGALLTRKQITIRIEQLLDKNRSRLHRSPAAALGIGLAGMLAVAFVATSAPAVELPAEAATAPIAAMPAEPPSTTVRASIWQANPAKPRFAKVAEKSATTPSAPYAVREQRIIRIVQTVQPRRPAQPPLPAKVLPKVPVTATKPKVLGQVATAPEVAVPPLPPLPAVRSFSPETLGKIRAASAAAATHSQGTHDAENVGTEVARVIQDVMGSIPREIAQEAGTPRNHGTRLDGVKLTRDLIAACLGCSFRHADVRGLDLHGLKISAGDFSGADMRGVNLSGAQLFGVSLASANLANADLRNAQLNGVDLRGANFDGAQLDGIKLFGVSVRHLGLRGTPLRNIIASCTGYDFTKLDLHGQDLHGISLSGADLSYADLRDANLSGVRFNGVNLSHTNLAGADLTNARFDGCDLSGVDLRGARTTGMMMHGSGLDG